MSVDIVTTSLYSFHTGKQNLKNYRPPVAHLCGDTGHPWAKLAHLTWLRESGSVIPSEEFLKENIWDPLVAENFPYGLLLLLENLEMVERTLWPNCSETRPDFYILLLALLINVKLREKVNAWSTFDDDSVKFSQFFHRVLVQSINKNVMPVIRMHLISFLIGAFGSLDIPLIRKQCASLVSISVWHNLHSADALALALSENPSFKKSWRAAEKRFEAGSPVTKAQLSFNRHWLYTLTLDMANQLYSGMLNSDVNVRLYCERVLELLIDLESMIPTRRFVNHLLHDLNLLSVIQLSPMYNDRENEVLRSLYSLLRHYYHFSIDSASGREISPLESSLMHNNLVNKLIKVSIKCFPVKLKLLTLANHASITKRESLKELVKDLDYDDFTVICKLMGFRFEYPESCKFWKCREFIEEVICAKLEQIKSFRETLQTLRVLPTERQLYEKAINRMEDYDGSQSLAVCKQTLQYLTVGDFLWRAFTLYRYESFFAIRKNINDAIMKIRPQNTSTGTVFNSQSRFVLPLSSKLLIKDVGAARVGEISPSYVKAELTIDLARVAYRARQEWLSMKPGDVVFLATVTGVKCDTKLDQAKCDRELKKILPNLYFGLKYVRAGEICQIFDDYDRPILNEHENNQIWIAREARRTKTIRFLIDMDTRAYSEDTSLTATNRKDVYSSFNVIIRRKSRENNFKPVMESMKKLIRTSSQMVSWLQGVFLGYGDPNDASYERMPNRLRRIDFGDTFLDWEHLVESFPGHKVEWTGGTEEKTGPYVVEFNNYAGETGKVSLLVSSYTKDYRGPFVSQKFEMRNTVRFTRAQVQAILSGTQPGLTVIMGPPGTGKTDVASQIIRNIYHNFPDQKTVVIAHSNQALNQIFVKIMKLDVDERHMVRLGHGEEELNTKERFSKSGRVESYIERSHKLLAEVQRLADSIGAPGAHGNSCETANYFNEIYVKRQWSEFLRKLESREMTGTEVIEIFPWAKFFTEVNGEDEEMDKKLRIEKVFGKNCSVEKTINMCRGCYEYIKGIFDELERIRPFEVLPNVRDKGNWYLIKEARIVAMTSTHAAMQGQKLADAGFEYENVVMEEAGQITEMEAFIPLRLQRGQMMKNGERQTEKLIRVVICGDAKQNSPIIQSVGLREYSNLDESLISRLVRLGVPSIVLEDQGRARNSIAELYRWRYGQVGNIGRVEWDQEYKVANRGLAFDYQFVNVEDYMGQGERESTGHFIQNVGEAEYAVALFMYLRRMGYDSQRISILAMYAGQVTLIKEVLDYRCGRELTHEEEWEEDISEYESNSSGDDGGGVEKGSQDETLSSGEMMNGNDGRREEKDEIKNKHGENGDVYGNQVKRKRLWRYGRPRNVSTVDKFQGEQNDIIILSLVRTKHVGYLRDIRRITVGLSRARLGLYILGRKEVFLRTGHTQMQYMMKSLLFSDRPEKLAVIPDEPANSGRLVADSVVIKSFNDYTPWYKQELRGRENEKFEAYLVNSVDEMIQLVNKISG